MRNLILLLLFIISSAHGYQYYYYDAEKVKLGEGSFRRYVRSHSRSIIAEFYDIISKISPMKQDITRLRRSILEQEVRWKEWRKKCRLVSQECTKDLDQFYRRARKLDQQILRLQKGNISRWQKLSKSTNAQVDLLLSISRGLDIISTNNYQSLHLIEEILITSGENTAPTYFAEDKFSPLLRMMLLTGDDLVIDQIDNPTFHPLFREVWTNFITKLERHILINNDQRYLLNHMDDFNIIWNSFHMDLKKSRFEEKKFIAGKPYIPKSVQNTVSMMHNRWNWILKLYLRNTQLLDEKKKAR